ncbi:hypothetical protein ACFWWM_16680 [Streptomyces sp. NPDC058682]|uniref:hypothetical protein n=1 Tax=unclassified Streptomyces TaxID=2593676 RepID=UPI00225A47BF|nr:hypothetical protein [Streptomyces sp. NBC_01214]MCX4804459.1 hypothetical protein [Streptomyces sp. NBC_01214]
MQLVWTLNGRGWADCTVADQQAEAEVTASYISTAPEDLLTAVARLVTGEAEVRVQFEAEPTAFRWILYREGTDVWIRVLELADGSKHDNAGTEIWSSQQSIDTVARAVVRCFDEVARKYGESGYRGKWGEHFPRCELEALRDVWHKSRPPEKA